MYKGVSMAKILVVDDEMEFRNYVCEVIRRMGHKPLEAENGREALSIFKKENVDLSFVDINMPVMDGITFLKEAKKIDPGAIIVIMTGFPSAETIIETIEDEGYTYITKPVEIEQLADIVERGLRAKENRESG